MATYAHSVFPADPQYWGDEIILNWSVRTPDLITVFHADGSETHLYGSGFQFVEGGGLIGTITSMDRNGLESISNFSYSATACRAARIKAAISLRRAIASAV
jgi:hypothetical protein